MISASVYATQSPKTATDGRVPKGNSWPKKIIHTWHHKIYEKYTFCMQSLK
jgi:hypothetical protein